MRTFARAVAVALGLVAPCSAAAQWSEPETLSTASTFVDSPSLVFSADARALASWSWQDGVGASARSGVRMASRARGGLFERELPGPRLATEPATYGSGRAVVLERRPSGGGERERLSARFGSTSGGFGRGHTLARASLAAVPALAAGGNGHVVAAWIERRGNRRVVLVATRAPGRRFSPAQVIRGTGRADVVSTAVNEAGAFVVAWTRHARVEARVRRYDGFGRVQTLGPAAMLIENRVVTAVTRNVRVYVAWSSRQLSEGGDAGDVVVRAAVRPAGSSSRFRAAQVLERAPGAQPQEARLSLATAHDKSATLAWTAAEPAAGPLRPRFVARVATTDARGAFGAAQPVSPPGHDVAVGDVAVSGTGEALVAWSRLDDVQEVGVQVFAARRPPGAAGFLPAEPVSPATERGRVPAVAYAPFTGLPTVVWSARVGPEGPGVPVAAIRTYARAATRPAA
jgi:hypothetical protein